MTTHVTRYEIAAHHTDGRAFLICYTSCNSHAGLCTALHERGAAIAQALGIAQDAVFIFHRSPHPHWKYSEWRLGFTGRTKRSAIEEGPLPSIGRPELHECGRNAGAR